MTCRTCLTLTLLLFITARLCADEPDLGPEIKKLGAKLVATDAFKASFSPDGKKLAVGRMPPGAGLSIVDVADGKAVEITKEGKDPTWRPKEGGDIAYVTKSGKDEEIWLVSSTGEKPRKVIEGGYPTWSADGATLYCQARKNANVLALDVDGETPKVKQEFEIPFSYYPAVSPNGKLVAFHDEMKLNIYDLSAKKLVRTWPVPGWSGLLPSWSPDSKQVTFGTYGHGDGAGFWLLDIPAARVTELAKGSYTMGAWSHDGKQFAFDLRELNKYRVLVMDADKLPK